MKIKKILLFFVVLGLFLGIAFFSWRRKAAGYQGQNLHEFVKAKDEADPNAPVNIIFIGDMGTGDIHQKEIAEAMNAYCYSTPLSAVVFLGDNFYPHGVRSVDDPQWDEKFLKPYGLPCLKSVPFYALLGNHDYQGNTLAQIEKKTENPSWNMPHRFFDVTFGKTLSLTLLDTNVLDVCGFSRHCSLDFLWSSLEKSQAAFKIVLGHHPIRSSSGKYSRKTFQGRVFQSLLCGKAHYYIAGHSHHLEHLTPEANDCSAPLDYFIVGGGGADLYDIPQKLPTSKYAESKYGFMTLTADEQSLRFTFLDKGLNPLYVVTKTKAEETSR